MSEIRSVPQAKQISILDHVDAKRLATRFANRLLSMATAWAALGFVEGGYTGLVRNEGMIMLIAQTIAGMIVLVWLGTILGCVFNRALESLVGGLIGFLIGFVLLPAVQVNDLAPGPAVTLIMGGVIGATCWPLLTIMKRFVSMLLEATFGSRISDGVA